MWTCGWNQPGYLPEAEPMECETWEGARDALIFELERVEDDDAAADAAMTFLHQAPSGQACTTAPVGGYVYWITEAEGALCTVTAGDGSRWVRTKIRPSPYGRPIPAGRAYWFQRVPGSTSPDGSALRGIAGFYAAHPDGRRL